LAISNNKKTAAKWKAENTFSTMNTAIIILEM
jgi:hypothetical protein